jgi:hypothetical protein
MLTLENSIGVAKNLKFGQKFEKLTSKTLKSMYIYNIKHFYKDDDPVGNYRT